MIKKLMTIATTLMILLPVPLNSYAVDNISSVNSETDINDENKSYTVVVTNDGLNDDWISKTNFNYDLIWTIMDNSLSCESSDGSIYFNADIHDDTLYVEGTDFLFAVCEIPDIYDEEESEESLAMLRWIKKLHNVRNLIFSDDVKNFEIYGSSIFFAGVENIDFGNSLKRIGENTIGLPMLRTVKLPETLTAIGSNAFKSCDYLEKIVIPSGIEKIGENAFEDCLSLKDITILSKEIELNNKIIGYSSSGKILEDVIIRGYKGSTAETYANENGFTFIALDEEPITTTSTDYISTETTTTITSTETDVTDTSETTTTSTETDLTDTSETTTTSTETDLTDTSETTTTSTETDVTDTSETTTTSTDEQLPQAGMPWARTVEGLAVMLIAGGTMLIVKSRKNEG